MRRRLEVTPRLREEARRTARQRQGLTFFSGQHFYALDNRGRLVFPADCLRQLGNPFPVLCGPEPWLVAFPQMEWMTLSEVWCRDVALHIGDLSTVTFCEETDSATRRVQLPHKLRMHADFQPGTEICIVGVGRGLLFFRADGPRWDRELARRSDLERLP